MKKRIGLSLSLLSLICSQWACAAEGSSFWVEGEYLLWSIKRNPVSVPLLTTASFSDPLPGAIGQSGSHVLLGESDFQMGWMNGFRVQAGGRLSPHVGLEASYFLLPSVSKRKTFRTSGEPGAPNSAVPIEDLTGVCGLNGIPGETIFILPGPLSGDPGFFGKFDFCLTSALQGVELNASYQFVDGKQFEARGLGGFCWFQLDESLHFHAKTHTVANVSFPAGFFNFSDHFSTQNDFLAAQLGIDGHYRRKKWKIGAELKGAVGALLETVKIKGSSRTSGGNLFFETQGTAQQTLPGGIFAEPSNRGKHQRSRFAFAFAGRVNTGYQLTRHLKLDLGYTLFWLSRVLRPGKQIDRKINSTRTALADASRRTVGTGPGPIPFGDPAPAPAAEGPKGPKVHFRSSTFYLQGLDAGIILEF